MQSGVLAFVVENMDSYLGNQAEGFAIRRFQAFQIGRQNVVTIAWRNALRKFTPVIRIDFPAYFVGLIFCAANLDWNSIDRAVVGAPHRSGAQGIGFSLGFLRGRQAGMRTERRQENENDQDRMER